MPKLRRGQSALRVPDLGLVESVYVTIKTSGLCDLALGLSEVSPNRMTELWDRYGQPNHALYRGFFGIPTYFTVSQKDRVHFFPPCDKGYQMTVKYWPPVRVLE